MNADGMADETVVPSTRVNKAATAVAESAEERDLTEGKYCRIGVDASDSEPEQVSIGASREITTGSVTKQKGTGIFCLTVPLERVR